MDQADATEDSRHATNPLFNGQKFKLGTFCTNLSGGCTISSADGVLEMTWPNTSTLARLADDMKFEALVPIGRWKGFGGVTNFNGDGFEAYTWAAGIAAQTRHCGVFATSHVPTVHPCMAAKQGMTIDHISGGRFNLNVVCGWYETEIEMFGAPLMEHDRRYDMASEWITIIKKLWTSEEEFDFDGEFFHVKKAICGPLPVQKPYPVIMSAGASERGRKFAAEHCDVGFTGTQGNDLDGLRALIKSYQDIAWREYRRDIKVWTCAFIYQGDTEKEARDLYDYVVHEMGDDVACENLTSQLGINSRSLPAGRMAHVRENFKAGWGGYPIIGTKEQVVEGLQFLAKAGFDGTLLSWPKYIDGMREFQDVTYPLVVQAGLR
jgi:alkanesulfonate monooxygenase SsuD/methylene tetrahydromethanopterin reductase-like flavin-dependent oxidoreductase (luciferase family)